jgi:hypothetical protein
MRRTATAASCLLLLLTASARAADVPSPESHLGFRPGADFHLAPWPAVVEYFRKVDEASDRVSVRELGRTTEGRPYVVAVVSAPETIRKLSFYQDLQRRLADPRVSARDSERADPVDDGKAVVLITCSIHSSETASTLMAMELLHDLAAGDDPATREVLDKTILLLVPSANPDGVDKVASWYERTKGHPWEGGGMPELYHKYAGHDTNRDWFMLNLAETRLLTRLLYKEWFPTITYDVHQMGSKGARLFVPPFHDPINPNLDPRLHQGIALIGTHMAADLAAEGKRGVLTNAMYDNWWNGGNRTTPQRHNMVGVLTEAASVRLASPMFLDKADLAGSTRGFADHRPAVNFVDPWPGGWWRLRDIVDYELICARSVLTLAARYRRDFQRNYRALGQAAVAKGKSEPPYAWLVPADQRDPGTAATLVRILHDTGVEVRRAREPFRAGGVSYPAGTWIFPAAQPYRAHLKDMMERQHYPERLLASGSPEPPYDVAGWTLPLQMGVRAVEVADPIGDLGEPVDAIDAPRGSIDVADRPDAFSIEIRGLDDFYTLNALVAAGVEVTARSGDSAGPAGSFPAGTFVVAGTPRSRRVLDEILTRSSTRVTGERMSGRGDLEFRRPRIGVYQPWMPSMDEGWTRLVLDRFGFPYTTLHNAEVRAGDLAARLDTIILPSIEPKVLKDGYARDQTEPAYVGGLGTEGLDALRAFVRAGGTLVCFEESCPYAIDGLDLPVKNVLKDVRPSSFYGPGSIVRVRYTPAEGPFPSITSGMPEEGAVYFDRSLAFDVTRDHAKVLARFAPVDVLESGWLLGPEKIQGKACLVEVAEGRGRVVLFGFPPQNRGQTYGTFRLLFNALLRGSLAKPSR